MRNALILLTKRLLPTELRGQIILKYQHALHWWKYGDASFPHSVCLEISTFCNRTCHYCPNSTNKTPTLFMPEELFVLSLKRLQEIKWAGPIDYNRYNEPTLDKRLLRFVALTKEYLPKALPRVISNGDVLNEDYMGKLIRAGIVNFSITRHPPFRKEWDERIAHLRKVYPAYVRYNEIWNRSDLSNRAGAVNIENYRPITSCTSPSIGFNIMYTGDVMLCCADYHRQHTYGNIREKSIMEIWNNPEFRQVRDEVKRGNPRLDICKACFGQPVQPKPAPARHLDLALN